MAAHRYWRLYVSEHQNIALEIAELQLTIDGVNQCGSGTASASSASLPAANAFDSDIATYWRTPNALPQWLKYDFGSGQERDINGYVVIANVIANSPQTWVIEYSDDDSVWSEFHAVTGASFGGKYVYPIPPGRALTGLLRRDMEDGGPARITDLVDRLGVLGRYRVRLYDRRSGRLLRETWSSALGAYAFDWIADRPNGYYVAAFDHDPVDPKNAAIADLISPTPMPPP
jgi:hypothetical protein